MNQTLNQLRKRRHLSHSQVNQLLFVCSLQYYYERVARLPKPFVSHSLVFGSCVHKTLEHYYQWLAKGETPDSQQHTEMFSQLWEKACAEQNIKFSARHSAESLNETGRSVVTCFLENIDAGEKVLAVSQAFCVPVRAPDRSVIEEPMVGEFDLVVEREGRPVIVDFKTASRKWAEGHCHKSLQATVYSHAWRQMYGVSPEVEFRVVTKTAEPCYERHVTRRSAKQELRLACLLYTSDAADDMHV